MVEAIREQHPRSKIVLTIEIRTSITVPTRKPLLPRRKVPEADEKTSSPIPSSSPVVQEKERKIRTALLETQQAALCCYICAA